MVEITESDVRKPDTLPAAVADVDVVVSVHDVAGVAGRRPRPGVARPHPERGRPGRPDLQRVRGLAPREARPAHARVRHVPRRLLRVLAPLHRQPRAGYAMDTTDLTFRPGPRDIVGSTDLRRALGPQDADESHR
jgi:hypothetical protein